jgi:MscS family membrane protein
MLLALVAVVVLGTLGGRALRYLLAQAARRTTSRWDDLTLRRLSAPLTAFSMVTVGALLVPFLSLSDPATSSVYRGLRVGYTVVAFWSAWRLIDIVRQRLAQTHWALALPASRSLLPLSSRLAKVAIVGLALVAVLSTLGYPVASIVAGLGIGGIAIALAAQKTIENLFGAFSIGIDQPFREGDFVKVDDFVGTVEAIGLRSSRFRTLDRTVITLPNGRLADMRLESFAARDRLRLAAVIGLVYETKAAQMRTVLAGFERVLRSHPKVWPDAVTVRFSELAASSLNIEVMAWFQTADWGEFQRIREDILLAFMEIVESAGTSFAFPTTTVHLAPTGAGAALPPRRMVTSG